MNRYYDAATVALLTSVVIIFSTVGAPIAAPSGQPAGPQRRMGMWIDSGNLESGAIQFSPQEFVQLYFETPPYFSTVWLAGDALILDQQAQWSGLTWMQYYDQVLSQTDTLPNVQVIFFNLINPKNPDAVSNYESFANMLASHPSVKYVIRDPEYYSLKISDYQWFIDLYKGTNIQVLLPNGQPKLVKAFPDLLAGGYLEFPWFCNSDSKEAALQSTFAQEIGLTMAESGSGGVGFPAPGSLPSDPIACANADARPPYNLNGWNEGAVRAVIDDNLNVGAQFRQFVIISPGGVPGWWSNPLLRSWFWSDSNYASNYVLSTSSGVNTETYTGSKSTSTITVTSSSTSTEDNDNGHRFPPQ